MAGYCHASTLRRLELETEKVQTGSTQVDPCQVCQEGSAETQTSRGFTRQDCIDYYIGKLGAFLYSYHSNPSIYRIMDSPHKTLESVKALKQIAKFGRRACKDKDYNGSEYFHRIVTYLEDLQWEVEESIPEWEAIMGEQ